VLDDGSGLDLAAASQRDVSGKGGPSPDGDVLSKHCPPVEDGRWMEPTAPVNPEVSSPFPGNTHPHLARECVALGFLVGLQRPDVRPVASAHSVAHHLLPRPSSAGNTFLAKSENVFSGT
jgi:hypothetical protein